LPIALDVANGMAYLHSRNVIHRDLKPSNILLTRDHRAKIADFGMSIANSGQELTAETGTYRYMAPEVIRHESYSSNADVYSFGICLWQLITREVPFASMTPIQAAYAVAEGRRPPIPTSIPRRLREIVTTCWDQDSHKRPSFTYISMALADYATLQIANVDFATPVLMGTYCMHRDMSQGSNIGLEI
jgi:serine/threonine protein kinase